jgi:hypothetical protein
MVSDLSAYPDNQASRAGWGYQGDVENNILSSGFSPKVLG